MPPVGARSLPGTAGRAALSPGGAAAVRGSARSAPAIRDRGPVPFSLPQTGAEAPGASPRRGSGLLSEEGRRRDAARGLSVAEA